MGKFAEAFKKARLGSGKKFRELKDLTEMSIGYLSDIESGRRNPPELSIVEQIEKFFGITDQHLVKLAKKERIESSDDVGYLIQGKPKLQELLLRADGLPDEQLADLLEKVRVLTESSEDNPDHRLFLNQYNAGFFDWRTYPNQ